MEISKQLQRRYLNTFAQGIYKPSPIRLRFIHEDLPLLDVTGTFYVSSDARVWIWFEQVSPEWFAFLQSFPAKTFSVEGVFEDGRTLLIKKAQMIYQEVNTHHREFSSPKVGTIHSQGPTQSCFTAMALSSVTIKHGQKTPLNGLRVRYTLINAIFWGTEMIKVEGTGRSYRGLLPLSVGSRLWKLVRLEGFSQDYEADLKNGIATILPTATAEITAVKLEEIPTTDKEINALCRLISAVTCASTTWVVRQTWDGNTLIEEFFASQSVNTDAVDKSRYNVIDGIGEDGLKTFLESSVHNFLTLEYSLQLHKVIDYMEQSRHQKVLQVQIATILVGLELLSYMWCLRDGLTEQQLETMNIESKLGRMRRTFRFIEKGFTNEILRRDIRNPLIHSGQIPLLSTSELVSWNDDLYLLTLRLLFALLGYKGKYRDFSKGFTVVTAPII